MLSIGDFYCCPNYHHQHPFIPRIFTKLGENMADGRGWAAIALVIFAIQDSQQSALSTLLFSGINSFQYRMQTAGITTPATFLK